ncbi:hypothetical protein B5X24_HaOG210313 [Helicoverpa armigera]|nr:hypothetical protein B5X24_HaOG210313 [Helicoverpa armigera]
MLAVLGLSIQYPPKPYKNTSCIAEAALAVALGGAARSGVPLCAGARSPSSFPPFLVPRGPDQDTDSTEAKCYEIEYRPNEFASVVQGYELMS